jgi:hypothetical protein
MVACQVLFPRRTSDTLNPLHMLHRWTDQLILNFDTLVVLQPPSFALGNREQRGSAARARPCFILVEEPLDQTPGTVEAQTVRLSCWWDTG